jgi:quinohemoprotein ethanol dehydrogenase
VLNRFLRTGSAALLAATVIGCASNGPSPSTSTDPLANPVAVDQQRLLKGTSDPSLWAHYGGSYNEQRFSPLKQINDGNVKDLGLAWFADYRTNQNQHGSPLYVDGVIYVSTARNVVHAYDARNGKELWVYHPNMIPNPNLGLVNRGIAAYNGKIYMGQLDAKLVAIDAKTGQPAWVVDTVPASTGLPEAMRKQYSITMAPRVAKGKVFVGGSGGEFGVRGWIAAYDAETGQEVWRFWTVPGDPALGPDQPHLVEARKTWPQDVPFWQQGGGGTIWDAVVYDPETDLLYFGTGNGTPWNREMRDASRGDNLYVCSIIAVKPDTGEYVWHYQVVPGDSWDYDAVSPMFTADLTIKGQKRHVLVQPSKNGFIYVLDAKTGEFISGDAFTGVTWALGIDENGRPIEAPGARYETEPFNVGPGAPGGHTWHPNAFSPDTGLVYIPTWENYNAMVPQVRPANGPPPLIAFGGRYDPATLKPHNKQANDGWLQAWDPVARKTVWESERGPRATSGVLATGGNLVFMGNSGGKMLRAFHARTGEVLWEFDAQTDVYAAPITYELDGVQYIAASVGGTGQGDYFAPGYGRMLVFKLGGTAKLPPNAPYTPRPLNPPALTAPADVVARGAQLYADNCAVCHGPNAVPGGRGGNGPNLTTSPFLHSQAGFDQVVLQGGRNDRGMQDFRGKLTEEDSAALLAYIVSRANDLKNNPPPAPAFGPRGGGAGAGAGGGAAAPPPRDVHEEAATQQR